MIKHSALAAGLQFDCCLDYRCLGLLHRNMECTHEYAGCIIGMSVIGSLLSHGICKILLHLLGSLGSLVFLEFSGKIFLRRRIEILLQWILSSLKVFLL